MNTLRPDSDLEQLSGLELLQVCLGRHQTQLRFDKQTMIAFEAVGVLDPGGIELATPAVAGASLAPLLGTTLLAVRLDREENLVLQFSGGQCLRVENDIANLESFEVVVAGKRL